MRAQNRVEVATQIVSAFVSNNSIPSTELSALIEAVHATVKTLRNEAAPVPANEPISPAVSIRSSITPDYLICLDDGRRFKSLKRHLTHLGMTPAQYRAKWSLPPDYPMVAANYAARRSELALRIGLGRKKIAPPAAPPSGPRKNKVGRPRKVAM